MHTHLETVSPEMTLHRLEQRFIESRLTGFPAARSVFRI